MHPSDKLTALATALEAVPDVIGSVIEPPVSAVFVGSGDSLSSALLAEAYGHRAMSSGDITFLGTTPVGASTVVGISLSGTSGATVRALRLARGAGLRTIAITSNAASPLADSADELQLVPSLDVDELVPCAGHLQLGLGVAAVCGEDTRDASRAMAARIRDLSSIVTDAVAELSATPTGISVLSLPDLRGAADFWMLKLIEATGVTVRTAALEESGHVDYFLGPEARLVLPLIGARGRSRFDRLARALESTGQTVLPIDLGEDDADRSTLGGLLLQLVGAALGTAFAEAAATAWGRPPFRGGAVNMDASHIKLDDQPISS